jgi:hypothetical protein
LYNLERNSFNTKGLQVGGLDGFNNLTSGFAGDEFDALVASTIGSFNVRQSVSTQPGTNTTPLSVIIKNEGEYIKGAGDSDILRPTSADAPIGTAESMMGKTALGNPFADEDFLLGKRGVKHVVNTIKESDQPLGANFDPQNNTAYIIGANKDGSPRTSRQRYTITNPYAPQGAGKLVFLIKNYASGDEYSFPPYIESIQNTENANWNSTNFLGRPEAVYTYNNSSRDASISFYVLTDYAESVDIGRDWNDEGMGKVTANFGRHFTKSDYSQNATRRKEMEAAIKQAEADKKAAEEIKEKIDQNNAQADAIEEERKVIEQNESDVVLAERGWFSTKAEAAKKRAKQTTDNIKNRRKERQNASQGDELEERLKENKDEQIASEKAISEGIVDFNTPTDYSEASDGADNVYNIGMIKKEFVNGETICKPEDTIKRINTMKAGLMFQPAYFSGDKVDFVRKVEFLSKLTRPSANDSPTGFSFTRPPVCHIHLGDWWNHDIVVNSVSFDYAGAPWTLEGGRVQPMWVLVSINFNMIGPFRSNSGRPPLATDEGGMYSP